MEKGEMMLGINLGKKNGMWKGNKVKYSSLHSWVYYHFPKPKICSCCGLIKKLEIANISNKYKRDLSDWEWLCRKCHMTKDGRIKKLPHIKNKIRKNCLNCGKIFYTVLSIIRKNYGKYCSKSCSNKGR